MRIAVAEIAPISQKSKNSRFFIQSEILRDGNSPAFERSKNVIQKASAGFKCGQCDWKIRHGNVGYCSIHKRIVDMSMQHCACNTRSTYKRTNW